MNDEPKNVTIDDNSSRQMSDSALNRRFLATGGDFTDWSTIEPYFRDLIERPLDSTDALETFIADLDELSMVIAEVYARLHIATTIDTSNRQAAELLQRFQVDVSTRQSENEMVLARRYLASPFRASLDPLRYGHMEKLLHNSLDLYREENLPLYTEDQALGQRHASIIGGISAQFRGERHNLVRLSSYQQEPIRETREETWRLAAAAKQEVVEAVDTILDRLIVIRTQRARNVGYDNFRDFHHQVLRRFDYSPQDCLRFHRTIKEIAVPALIRLQKKRQSAMQLPTLRPWDTGVDQLARPPLHPFSSEKELIMKTADMLDRLHPNHGDRLRVMYREGNLDLMTRQHKAMVGYNTVLEETGSSFIFMNSDFVHGDITVLAHEAGHAIEKAACRNQPLMTYRRAPSEWAELASQSHQLLALDHLDVFYDREDDRCRCIAAEMEQMITFFPRVAKIDAFQHWLYLNPEHTHQQRHQKWLELSDAYDGIEDWSGLEHYRKIGWQTIAHLFFVPFYYIEYGISQLGAVQVWRNVRRHGQKAMQRFLDALRLGFSHPIPHQYHQAGIRFEFFGPLVKELLDFVEEQHENACK